MFSASITRAGAAARMPEQASMALMVPVKRNGLIVRSRVLAGLQPTAHKSQMPQRALSTFGR